MPNLQASLITASVFCLALGVAAVSHTKEFPRRAPYNAVRWEGETASVRIGEEWVGLASIDGVAVGDIVAYCRQTYGRIWQKRFEEDLVEVLIGMEHTPGDTVQLVVQEQGAAEPKTLDDVPLTLANRQAIWWAAQANPRKRPRADTRDSVPGDPAESFAKLAPYDAIRWQEKQPVVRIDGEWLALVSIDAVTSEAIVDYCQPTYGRLWQKRFEEDLVEVLAGMGHATAETVRLVVRDPDGSEERVLEEVAMTRPNRQAIWHAAHARKLREKTNDPPADDDAPN